MVIVAIRGERGSYDSYHLILRIWLIVAIRGERGSYDPALIAAMLVAIVAIRGEIGSYDLASMRVSEAQKTPLGGSEFGQRR